jgi:putative transposase
MSPVQIRGSVSTSGSVVWPLSPTQAGMSLNKYLSYKTGWYGSQIVVADRWFPSSKTCHECGHVQDIGWDEHWQCAGCSVTHQRDDNAAINLARYEETLSVVGPVGAAVKGGAERKTRPSRAGGPEARREPATRPGNNPEMGRESRDH